MNTGAFPFTDPEPEQALRTRCGYPPNEVIQAFQKAIAETGTASTGRCLHFAADLVCSGGLANVFRILWEYAIQHIGLASPRVFVYLKQRIADIENIMKTLPDETAYSSEDFQIRIGELIIVLRDAPTRSLTPWPKVGTETHESGWIRGAATDTVTESAALRKAWRPEGDMSLLRTAGAHICKAINDGSTERALWWIKWLLEEDSILGKNQKGATLSTLERGPATLSSKQRKEASFFVLHLYSEIYKEMAAKQLIRMNEEFQALLTLWGATPKGVGGGHRKQILVILTQILAEVPKWKVPAAAPLIRDPIYIANAIKQVPKFFKEVLAYDSPKRLTDLTKALKSRGGAQVKRKVQQKPDEKLSKMEAFEKAMEAYMGGKG